MFATVPPTTWHRSKDSHETVGGSAANVSPLTCIHEGNKQGTIYARGIHVM